MIVNTLSNQAAEITGSGLGGVVYFLLGPRNSFISMFLFSCVGATMLLMTIEFDKLQFIPFFLVPAKFGVAATFTQVYIAAMQLTPTLLTPTFFGLCNLFARSATMLAPLVAEIDGVLPIKMIIAGTLFASIVSFFLVTKLPRFT